MAGWLGLGILILLNEKLTRKGPHQASKINMIKPPQHMRCHASNLIYWAPICTPIHFSFLLFQPIELWWPIFSFNNGGPQCGKIEPKKGTKLRATSRDEINSQISQIWLSANGFMFHNSYQWCFTSNLKIVTSKANKKVYIQITINISILISKINKIDRILIFLKKMSEFKPLLRLWNHNLSSIMIIGLVTIPKYTHSTNTNKSPVIKKHIYISSMQIARENQTFFGCQQVIGVFEMFISGTIHSNK